MKIAVTGTSSGFGKYILDNYADAIGVSLRGSLEDVVNKVKSADVLINLAYSNDTRQSLLFNSIFNIWEHSQKTVVNIGTSAITENTTFDPLYVSNKKHLINLSNSLCASSPYKQLRVINFNPSTLENNTIFGDEVSKLKFEELYNILIFILRLPHHIEISDLIIRSTQRLKQRNI